MERKNIMMEPEQEKAKVYEEIDALFRQGKSVTIKEHKSGSPAVTMDCEDIHIITDILSLEKWWVVWKKQERR